MPKLALLTFLLLALAAVPAEAARVQLVEIYVEDDDAHYDREDDSYRYSVLRFKAGPGERNRLAIRRLSRGRISFRDARARVRPGNGCRAAGRRAAVCRRGVALRRIDVRLRGGADRLTVSSKVGAPIDATGGAGSDRMTGGGGAVEFDGGPGGDRLTGSARSDELYGGSGRDRLMGGRGRDWMSGDAGRDRLLGGRDNDTLLPADGEDDSVDGGSGRDRGSYLHSKASVDVTPQGGGAAGERDTFKRIEDLTGSLADDVLNGDDGPNRIKGGGGHDRIDGRGGDDLVDAYGASAAEGSVDATCGDGKDRVELYVGNDRVLIRRDCEAVDFSTSGLKFDPRPTPPSGRAVQIALPCAEATDAAASRVVTLRTAPEGRAWFTAGPFDSEIATGTLAAGALGQNCTTTVELSDAGAALLQANPQLPVVVRVGTRYFTPFAVVLSAT